MSLKDHLGTDQATCVWENVNLVRGNIQLLTIKLNPVVKLGILLYAVNICREFMNDCREVNEYVTSVYQKGQIRCTPI